MFKSPPQKSITDCSKAVKLFVCLLFVFTCSFGVFVTLDYITFAQIISRSKNKILKYAHGKISKT